MSLTRGLAAVSGRGWFASVPRRGSATRTVGINRYNSNTSLPKFDPSPSFRLTQPPDPDWDLGDGLHARGALSEEWAVHEESGWKSWVASDMAGR